MKCLFSFAILLVAALAANLDASSCTCGFYDEAQDNLWTDSVVVYFNESTNIPNIFVQEDYKNRWEQGWNAQFIQGAVVNNSWIGNSTANKSQDTQSALQLFVSPSNPNHVVFGGSIRTQRQDIQYGSFRAFMKGPAPFAGGTALSMTLDYNLTQQTSLNIMNTDHNDTAWIATLMNNEFYDRLRGVNYTNIVNPAFGPNLLSNPWDYNDMRIDWTPDVMNFWLGGNLSRSVTGMVDDGTDRPSTPVPLRFKHWSDGNEYAMEGPPMHNRSEANVLFVRAFFNTTSMNDTMRQNFDSTCNRETACSTEDMNLRGSTSYPPESTARWVQADDTYTVRWPAVGIMVAALLVSISVLSNVILRRIVLPKAPKKSINPPTTSSSRENVYQGDFNLDSGGTTPLAMHRSPFASGFITPATLGARTIISSAATSATCLPTSNLLVPLVSRDGHELPSIPVFPFSHRSASISGSKSSLHRPGEYTEDVTNSRESSAPGTPFSPNFTPTRNLSFLGPTPGMVSYAPAIIGDTGNEEVVRGGIIAENVKGKTIPISSTGAPSGVSAGGTPAPRQKIDYLAGLLAVCSTLVSLTHYMLTFLPATIQPGAFAHYESENWARKTVGWVLFNEIWVVLFFTTSSRFLTTKYLRSGDLGCIAEKATSRVFRLMIPIIGVIILEYFLMDVGAVDWLQTLASVSWSTWPYTIVYDSFGAFISETLELIYLVPNAQPQITFNYCTGVLWTIPVQLDGSWQAMLSVVVFREIKTPWKRFSWYFIVVLTHWYARSWGGLFVAGLFMADLDVTFKYRKALYANKWLYYPLLNLIILLALGSLANDLVSQWTGINFQEIEDGWHIDKPTGMAMIQSQTSGYPPYYIPKLNSLVFAVCAQLLVEWSTVVQKCISIKLVLWLFPHIFTIYLFHGFIFWSIGSWVCVGMSGLGAPYWANMLVTAISCYAALYLSLPIITPVVEALGKSVTMSIWASASEQPPPKRPTTHPFPKDLFTGRNVANPSEPSVTTSSASSFFEKQGTSGVKTSSSGDTSSSSSLVERAIPPGENKWPLFAEKGVPF